MGTRLALVIFSALPLAAAATSAPAQAPRAWLVDSNLDQLFAVDLNTGAATLIGSTAGVLATPAGLAWRNDTQTLWTIDLAGGAVGTLDVTTGAFAQVYTANPTSGWQGIDWDPTTGQFFLLNQTNMMYRLDPTTGATTLLGPTNATMTGAIETDAAGTLWAINFSPANLYRIDKMTGAATLVTATMPAGVQGMAFAPNGTLYLANSNDDSLYTVNTTTGVTTRIGPHGAGVQFAKGFEIQDSGCTGWFARVGTGCRDATSTVVTMTWSGTPCIGQTPLVGAAVGGNSLFLLALGTSSTRWGPLTLPFALAPFGNPGCTVYASQDVSLGGRPGSGSVMLPIPNDPTLAAFTVHFQATVLDPALPGLGIATSDLLTMTIGK